jgi:outer membrane biosynthesis protein TonB
MKKLFLILAAVAFMVACTPKSQPVEAPQAEEEVVVVDDSVVDQPTTTTTSKPATKPATPKTDAPVVETPKEEPKVEAPKEEPKEDPAPEVPKKKKTR